MHLDRGATLSAGLAWSLRGYLDPTEGQELGGPSSTVRKTGEGTQFPFQLQLGPGLWLVRVPDTGSE